MLRAGKTVLGELESAVLEHLWKVHEADAKDVHAALGSRGITLNTVQSAMKRLFEKGLLERRKHSHAHLYSARVSREDIGRSAVEGVVERLMNGEANAMVATFVDLIDEAGPEHLDELARLVEERRRLRGKHAGGRK